MGAAGSVLEGESYDKEKCIEVAGDAFTEELWNEHSVDGVISGGKLLLLASPPAEDNKEEVIVIDDGGYEGERNEQGQKHGQGKFTYENGKYVIFSRTIISFLLFSREFVTVCQ